MNIRHNFPYFFKEGIRGIFKHGFMSFASVCVMTVSLTITGVVILLMLTLTNTITEAGSSGDICVYPDETLSDEEAAALSDDFKAIPGISSLRYIDRTEALNELRDELGEDASLLDGLENDNPLRSYYRIWVTNIDDYAPTLESLRNIDGVVEICDSLETIQTLLHFRRILLYASIAFLTLLGLVAIFLISNTLKLISFDRKEEIGIMKLIGATNSFIHAPFLIESIGLSLFSAFLAFSLQWLADAFLSSSALSTISFLKIADFRQYCLSFAVGDVSISLFLGIVGSILPLRKYMRV